MIAEGLVSARMDMRNQTVEFIENENSEFTSNAETVKLIETLEQHNQRIVQLMKKAGKLDNDIRLSSDFIQANLRKRGNES